MGDAVHAGKGSASLEDRKLLLDEMRVAGEKGCDKAKDAKETPDMTLP